MWTLCQSYKNKPSFRGHTLKSIFSLFIYYSGASSNSCSQSKQIIKSNNELLTVKRLKCDLLQNPIHENQYLKLYSYISLQVLLNIHQVTEEDYGAYICVATNEQNQQDRLRIELSKPVESATAKISCSISFFTLTLVSSLLLQ